MEREKMTNTFSEENLNRLIIAAYDDTELMGFISERLSSFEDYHQAIYKQSIYSRLYSGKNQSREEYREKHMEFEESRTSAHNAVLASVKVLNRLAKECGIPVIYDGVVSEDNPYRRMVADAVLAYVESVILNRK